MPYSYLASSELLPSGRYVGVLLLRQDFQIDEPVYTSAQVFMSWYDAEQWIRRNFAPFLSATDAKNG